MKKPPRQEPFPGKCGAFATARALLSVQGMLLHLPTNHLTEQIIGCGMEVHREFGPGLLESTYAPCLAYELQNAGLNVTTEVPWAVNCKGLQIQCAYRLDLVVDDQVVVEVKAVNGLLPIHTAQLLTYVRLGGYQVGLLLSFNSVLLRDGIVRVINGHFREERT